MKPVYVYPGSFCPPTYGHVAVACEAAKFIEELIVICSTNPDKQDKWFSEEECKDLWCSYTLPDNIKIMTFTEFKEEQIIPENLIMVRGIRNPTDLDEEKKTVILNKSHYNISKYLYLWSNPLFDKVSSTAARNLTKDLEIDKLKDMVAPLVVTKLLEKVLKAKNVFLVTGKPGAGKSTFLKMLSSLNDKNIHITVDDFNKQIRQEVAKKFPEKNIYDLVKGNESEMIKFLYPHFLNWIKNSLKQVPPNSNVFIEAAYAMEENKALYKMLGGKILFVSCEDEICKQRIINRGTKDHLAFVEKIPNLQQVQTIAEDKRLSLKVIDSGKTLKDLEKIAWEFNNGV